MLDKDYSMKDCQSLWVSNFKCSTTADDFTGSDRCRRNVCKGCKIVTLSREITNRK